MTDNTNDLQDFFQSVFGGMEGFGTQGKKSGGDLTLSLELTRDEALDGGKRVVEITRPIECQPCEGVGALPRDRSECGSCDGGRATTQNGMFRMTSACGTCRGRGVVWSRHCPRCAGEGRSLNEESLKVTIPPGVKDGTKLRLRGKGAEGGGAVGDLYIDLCIPANVYCAREGANVFSLARIDTSLAAEGGETTVDIFGEDVTLRIPARAKTGQEVRRPGLGGEAPLPVSDSPYRHKPTPGRGDLIVSLVVGGDVVPEATRERLKGQVPPPETVTGFLGRSSTTWFFVALLVLAAAWVGVSLAGS